jgi:L-aspartate oxidase
VLVGTLIEIIREHPEIEILEHAEVRELTEADGRVAGTKLVRADGSIEYRWGQAVVLATGGVGQLFDITTNPRVATGDGWALAYHSGAELRDLEFLQYHPTALKLPGVNPAPLVSEAVRGAGAILVDARGRRFALAVDARGELAPRDIVARAVAAADADGGAWLDARAVPDFAASFPGITLMLARHGLDAGKDLLPVAPALHYAMGGISTDLGGRTTRTGLWAAGEVASTGVHGANRLASNSLLEGLVFADRVAREIISDLPVELDLPELPEPQRDDSGPDLAAEPTRAEMRRIMSRDVGVQRSEESLASAERELLRLKSATPRQAWRTANQLLVARLITRAALERRESRGGHARIDYPDVAAAPAASPETPLEGA